MLHDFEKTLVLVEIDDAVPDRQRDQPADLPRRLLSRKFERLLVDVDLRIGRDAEDPLLQFNL